MSSAGLVPDQAPFCDLCRAAIEPISLQPLKAVTHLRAAWHECFEDMMNHHLNKISEIEVEHVLKAAPTRWDRQIAVDLVAEMETYLGQVDTIPEIDAY